MCNVCGHDLAVNYIIRDGAGKHFVVGCDCVLKTDDTQLTTEVKERRKRLERIRKADRKRLERIRKAEKWQAECAIRTERHQARVAEATTANRWMLDILATKSGSGFVQSIVYQLTQGEKLVRELSDGQRRVLRDIYNETSQATSFEDRLKG
jgi:hypothetical protein